MKLTKFLIIMIAVVSLAAPVFAQDVPAWVKKLTLSGDVSVRTEFDTGEKNDRDRVRERGRFRLGLDTAISDKVKGSVGIETAGTNPTSAWVDFTDFQKASLFLSHAYIQYVAAPEFTVSGGVLKNTIPIWTPVQLVWKSDVNPYGVAANIKTNSSGAANFFANVSVLALTPHLDQWDPDVVDTPMSSIFIVQPGFEAKGGNTNFRAGVAIQKFALEGHATGGWLNANQSFTLFTPSWELRQGGIGGKYQFTFNGEFSKNVSDGINDWGSFTPVVEDGETMTYMLQGGFGTPSIRAAKDWQVRAAYRYMEQNAIPRGMGQTSAYEAQPGKGWECFFGLGLVRDLAFNATIYIMKDMDGNRNQSVSQFDLVYRF